jgi:hypothetical protein
VLALDRDATPALLPPGMVALARGQAYYHRPGNWTEQPNFFNPYWRPRLASVSQGLEALPFAARLKAALPGSLGHLPQTVITH